MKFLFEIDGKYLGNGNKILLIKRVKKQVEEIKKIPNVVDVKLLYAGNN